MTENTKSKISALLDEQNELHSSVCKTKKLYMKPELVALSGDGTEAKAYWASESSPGVGPS